MVLTIDELISLLSDLESSINNHLSSIDNNQYNDYLSHYPINNNLIDKSIKHNIVNYNITCYQNSPKVIESIEKTSKCLSEHQFFMTLTNLGG